MGSGIITLFVSNLPMTFYWSSLRQAFGRHGDVVDSFIANKLDRSGNRFGFVRFSNMLDASRAMERLNGFRLDKRKEDTSEHRELADGECGKHRRNYFRRIQCHIEDETLWRLNKCLLATMATVCSSVSVMERLHSWGLGEIEVKSLGGRKLLVVINDDELLNHLEEQDWSLVKEVFMDIEKWSVSITLPERSVWVEVMGVPLYSWNYITFKRIAEVWGSIVALGENANQTLGCEKLSLLISTNQMHKINEVIKLEVGKELFEVSVSETVLLDAASSKQKVGEGNKADLKVRSSVVVSSSSSTADSGRRKWLVSEGGDSSKSGEAIYVDCSGMCSHEYTAVQGNVETRFIGEQDLLGSRIEVPPVELASDQISTPKVSNNGLDQTSNLEVLNGGSDQAVILFNGLFKPSCWIWKILALPKLWMFRVYWAHRLMHLTKRTYRISR
ncbi:hypothetical protein V6N13_117262 [Hibiscus sabdariffa]